MSGRLRVARTTILGVMRSLGQGFSIVAVQLSNLVQKPNDEEALTRSVRLGYHLANLDDLVICRVKKKIIPNGLAKLVLASQASLLTRNLGKSRKTLAT